VLPFFLWYNLSLKLRIKDSLTSCSDCHETGLPRSSIVIWIQKTISRNRVTNPVCARCAPRHVNNQHRVHAHAHTHTARVIISRMCPPRSRSTLVELLIRPHNGTHARASPARLKYSKTPLAIPRSAPRCYGVYVRLSAGLVFDMTHACNRSMHVLVCSYIKTSRHPRPTSRDPCVRARERTLTLAPPPSSLSLFLSLPRETRVHTNKSPALLQRRVPSFLQTTLSLSRSI